MMKVALALLLAAIAATPAFAWNEPDGVRGVPWGATQEDLRVQLQRAGETARCDSPELCVSVGAKFGPVPVDIKYLFPKDGKLEMAILTFSPVNYRKLRAVFLEQYGEPVLLREVTTEGPSCSTITNEIVEWMGERVVIDLRRFASKTQGQAIIMLKSLRDRNRDTAGNDPEKQQPEQGSRSLTLSPHAS